MINSHVMAQFIKTDHTGFTYTSLGLSHRSFCWLWHVLVQMSISVLEIFFIKQANHMQKYTFATHACSLI